MLFSHSLTATDVYETIFSIDTHNPKFSIESTSKQEQSLVSPNFFTRNKKLIIIISTILVTLYVAVQIYLYFAFKEIDKRLALYESPTPQLSPSPDPTTDWKTYTNREFGFELKHPAWTEDDTGSYGVDYFLGESKFTVNLISSRVSDNEGSTVPVSISVLPKPANLSFQEWLNKRFATGSMQKGSIEDVYNGQHSVYNESTKHEMQIYEIGTFEKQTLEYQTFFYPTNSQYIYAITLELFTYGNGNGWQPPDSYFIDAYKKILSTFKFTDQP